MTISETVEPAWLLAANLPCWQGAVDPKPLAGGLSNSNFVVDHAGERFVVRVGGDVPEHDLERARDIAVSKAAYLAGLSPEPIHAQADAQVIRWVEGKTLAEVDVNAPGMLERIVPLIRQCHFELPRHLPGRKFTFDALEACQTYGRALVNNGYRLTRDIPAFLALGQQMADVGSGPEPAFCHNDFLAANLIDDGSRLWLIDWEYGGFNNPLFDLANLASNNNLEPDSARQLLELYFDSSVDGFLWRQFTAMKVLSLLREAMWSMTAEMHSHLDIDYAAYTDEQLARLDSVRAELAAL
jgi:thiamine kinase-like enzyme